MRNILQKNTLGEAPVMKGHKVLLLGQKVFGPFGDQITQHDNATIETIMFPEGYHLIDRLSDYRLIILDYTAFAIEQQVYESQQEVFEKLMIGALDKGTHICFVHFNEAVPRYDQHAYSTNHMRADDMKQLREFQIGYRWLDTYSLKPYQLAEAILSSQIQRGEFKPFVDGWGASHNCFSPYGNGKVDEVICGSTEMPVGFVLKVRSGGLIYLPYQRDFKRKDNFLRGLHTLVDCLLTYISKTWAETPAWAGQPFFSDEVEIRSRCSQLEAELEKELKTLTPFDQAKSLMCQSEYMLESAVPLFIAGQLGLRTQKEEKYQEDFWILDTEGNRAVIVEVKSIVKGFKKSAIFSLFNHRESNKLTETFPAVLIANHHLQAGSWLEKDRPIDKQDYEVAAQNNILILRVEDLVRLWHALTLKKLTQPDILSLLMTKKGWLEVSPDHEIRERF